MRISHKDWDPNGKYFDSKLANFITFQGQSEYSQLEMLVGSHPGSALNNTQNLKLSDYLRIVDPGYSSVQNSGKMRNQKVKQNDQLNRTFGSENGANITFESLSAIAKLFSNNTKPNDGSEFEFDDERINDSNLEEVTEEEVSDVFDKRNSLPDFTPNQKENIQNNLFLMNAIKNTGHKTSYPQKSICDSVIIESEKHHKKRSGAKNKHFKKPGMNTLQRKFTSKNKRESESLLIYNDEYKDQAPKQKRSTIQYKSRTGGSRRTNKDHKREGRFSSRKTLKVPNVHRQSHKRSQSLNKSNIEHRYRSVPHNPNYEHERQPKKSSQPRNSKTRTFINTKTPQVHLSSKSKNEVNQLDFSLKHAKKNLDNYFRDGAKNKFTSLTGREKGNTLLRKVYLRMDNEYK